MKKIKITCLLSTTLLFPFVFYSCNESAIEPDPSFFILSNPPVITGIVITGESSPEPLGVWGEPNEKGSFDNGYGKSQDGESIPKGYSMISPFPNPTSDGFSLFYSLPVKTNVSIWIVRGILPGEKTEPTLYANGYFNRPTSRFCKKIYEGVQGAGIYSKLISLNDETEEDLSLAFYRIYLVIDNYLLWRNVAKYDQAGTEGGTFFR